MTELRLKATAMAGSFLGRAPSCFLFQSQFVMSVVESVMEGELSQCELWGHEGQSQLLHIKFKISS